MEQVVKLISKLAVVIVLLLVSVVFEEYFISATKPKGTSMPDDAIQETKNERIMKSLIIQLVQGLLFSLFIYMDSNTEPIGLKEYGIVYDSREIVLNLSVIYGPLTVTITAFAAVVIRSINPMGNAEIPVIGIILAFILEMLVLCYLKIRKRNMNTKSFSLIAFATGLGGSACILIMVGEKWEKYLLPMVILVFVYPILAISAYKIIESIRNSNRLVTELYKSEEKFNKMNAELGRRLEELRENEIHFKTMFYYSSEAIFLIKNNKIVDINEAGMEMLGYRRKKEIIGMKFSSHVVEIRPFENKGRVQIETLFARVEKGETISTEIKIATRKFATLLIEAFMIKLKTPTDEYIYLSARDISLRKTREKEILHKARYDEITNVANRKYFNEVIKKRLSNPENYPVCYLMADVNGLKLANDVFGHAKGDELIIKISSVLKSCCRSNDIVARIGGDEFAIFLTNTDEKTAESLVDRINRKLDAETYDSVKPSASIGYAVKETLFDKVGFDEIIKKADEMMYENKSASREKNRKIFLDNMVDKLYEMCPEEEVTSSNLKILLEKFKGIYAVETNVEKKLDKLISYINIGKLITPRIDWDMKGKNLHTLRFSGKLLENTAVILNIISKTEDNIISSEELYLINENWDGTGKKYGAAGEEIPLAIRIFKLIYDIYFLKRHREIVGALTNDEIIALIRSESGKRYDPELCKCRLEEIL